MLKKLQAIWNRAWRPFYVPGPSTSINSISYVISDKPSQRIIVNGVEYEWWVHANTPWDWPEFVSLGRSPSYEIYRQINYEEPIGPFEDETFEDGTPLVEEMADAVHGVWAKWMEYQFTKGTKVPTGGWIMDETSFLRWQRQMITPYSQLTESEKTSDRDLARLYLCIMLRSENESRQG